MLETWEANLCSKILDKNIRFLQENFECEFKWEEAVNVSKLEACIVLGKSLIMQVDFESLLLFGVTCKINDLHD